MCGHAGTVGTLRPLRRPPPPPGWPGTGRRAGEVAGPAGHRAAGGPHRRLPDGAPGLARPAAAGLADPAIRSPRGRPPPRRGRRPDLPHRPDQLGRPLRPDRADRPRLPPRPAAPRRQPRLPRLRHASTSRPGWPPAPASTSTCCSPRPACATNGSPPPTPAAPPAAMGLVRRAWDLAALGRAYEQFVAEQRALLADVTSRSSRRGGVRGAVPAGPRLAYLPLPATRSCPRRCCPSAGPAPPPPTSSTGTPPGCGRPPTATSSSAWSLNTRAVKRPKGR